MSWGGLRPDASAASDVGSHRLLSRRKEVCLDRLTPEGWVEIARFGDATAASTALDRAIADTGDAAKFRLRGSTAGRVSARIGLVFVAIAAVVLALAWLAIR